MIELTEDDLKLLRQIWRAGGKKYTAGSIDRTRYVRLETAGLLKGHAANANDVIYELETGATDYIQSSR